MTDKRMQTCTWEKSLAGKPAGSGVGSAVEERTGRTKHAHHPVFPPWSTHDIDHMLSDKGNGSNQFGQPLFSEHWARASEINHKRTQSAPEMTETGKCTLTDSRVREEIQGS